MAYAIHAGSMTVQEFRDALVSFLGANGWTIHVSDTVTPRIVGSAGGVYFEWIGRDSVSDIIRGGTGWNGTSLDNIGPDTIVYHHDYNIYTTSHVVFTTNSYNTFTVLPITMESSYATPPYDLYVSAGGPIGVGMLDGFGQWGGGMYVIGGYNASVLIGNLGWWGTAPYLWGGGSGTGSVTARYYIGVLPWNPIPNVGDYITNPLDVVFMSKPLIYYDSNRPVGFLPTMRSVTMGKDLFRTMDIMNFGGIDYMVFMYPNNAYPYCLAVMT